MISKAFNCLLVLLVAQLAVMSMGLAIEKRQGRNTIFEQYPELQTAAVNGTTQVFAIPRALAQQIVGPNRRLLRPTGLPAGFLRPDEHLAYTTLLYQTDIKQRIGIDVTIPNLSTQTFSVAFVDASGNGKTPFSFEINHVSQIIPSLGATIQGHRDVLARFNPDDKAYNDNGNGLYSWDVMLGVDDFGINFKLPSNDFTNVFRATFRKAAPGQLSAQQFQALISSKVLRFNGLCDAPNMFFNVPNARAFFARSSITLGNVLTGSKKTYNNVETYSGTYQWAYPSFGGPCANYA